MQTVVRRCSFLVYWLIFQLLGQPALFAAAKSNVSAPSAAASRSKKIAVVELYDGKVKPEVVEKVADTLRDELKGRGAFEVLSKESTYAFFESSPKLSAGGAGTMGLNRYLDQAKEFYNNFQFKEAISLLEGTIDGYRGSKVALTDPFQLTDAYLILANVQLGNNDPKRAQESLQEAVRLNPDREITELQYPPKTVALFQKVRAEFLKKAKSASLEIQISPAKAEVFVNGQAKGAGPVKLERWTLGDHFILVQAPGYKPQAQKLTLKAEGGREKFSLEKLSDPTVNRHGLSIAQLGDVDEQVRLGTAVGKALGLDKVVLVSVEEIGWNNKLSARMIDIPYQASHKLQSVEVLDLPKDTRSATHVMANNLAEAASLDLAKDPKKYADSEVLVIGNKKKKSFWKSPWLWGLIGVAVAGGATGALLLGKGGSGSTDNSSTVTLSGSAGRAP
ncbi:MAG: PEGA domain-containing protein [bacterium]